jgi:hypothetical protein
MRWDGTQWRRWNGQRWVTAAYSRNPERLRLRLRLELDPPIPSAKRRKVLDRAVEDQVAANAASVVFEGPTGVILGYRRPPAHARHLIMSLLTAGLWTPVWIAAATRQREHRVRLSVDDWGNVWAETVASA